MSRLPRSAELPQMQWVVTLSGWQMSPSMVFTGYCTTFPVNPPSHSCAISCSLIRDNVKDVGVAGIHRALPLC